MERIFEIASQIDRPLALGGLVAAALFFVLKRILELNVVAHTGAGRAWRVVKLAIEKLFVLALVAIVLGFSTEMMIIFMSQPKSVEQGLGSVPKIGIADLPPQAAELKAPELTSQLFNRYIGDGASCTEENVSRTFDLCLEPGFVVTKWTERKLSEQNSSVSVDRHEWMPNCVKLTLRYSDYGLGSEGECRGHGHINMEVALEGRR